MIEPGEKFTISYGKENTLEVVALSGRQKLRVNKLNQEVVTILLEVRTGEMEPVDILKAMESVYLKTEEMVKLCCPEITEQQLDSLDELLSLEIAGSTLAGAALSVEEKKRSELPPSSDAESSVEDAEPLAEMSQK